MNSDYAQLVSLPIRLSFRKLSPTFMNYFMAHSI